MTQLTLPDTSRMEAQRPRDLMADAVAWIEDNRDAWRYIVSEARHDAATLRRVRVKSYIEVLRYCNRVTRPDGSPVKLPNAYSAPIGRLLAAWYPDLAHAVPLGHSKTDRCEIPPAPSWAVAL